VLLQLNGALQFQDIVYLEATEVIAGEEHRLIVGSTQSSNILYQDTPLIAMQISNEPYSVGVLRVGYTRDGVYERLISKALRILLINASKTFVASLMIFWIIQLLVTRHIVSMAEYADNLSLDNLSDPLVLKRPSTRMDELDKVTVAINDLCMRLKADIAERKSMQSEKEQLMLDLHQAEKLKGIGELAGGIAHDFNNQLQDVIGYAELLKVEQGLNHEIIDYADRILNSCERATDLIDNLMAFSRKSSAIHVPININSVIREVMALLQVSLTEEIKLECSLDADPATINGDMAQIQSNLLNLGLNACDAIDGAGCIQFVTQNVNQATDNQVLAVAPDPDEFIRIIISDTGVGITEENQKLIFEPFFTTKEVGQGTGMGLAAVYGTIVSHKGSIDIQSKVNQGTSFVIYLPLDRS
jgi:signal transduction histidine kinase